MFRFNHNRQEAYYLSFAKVISYIFAKLITLAKLK
jgi:hypothetical protein